MPRPSWSRYTIDAAALALRSSPSPCASCQPQSQRSEWKTSPVRHFECMRTSTPFAVADVAVDERDVLVRVDVVPVADDPPPRRDVAWAGAPRRRGARAARCCSRCATSCATVMNVSPCSRANASSCGALRRRAVLVQDLADHAGGIRGRRGARGRPRLRCGRRAGARRHRARGAGCTWPGRAQIARAPWRDRRATWIVVARSCALMPVVTPKRGRGVDAHRERGAIRVGVALGPAAASPSWSTRSPVSARQINPLRA